MAALNVDAYNHHPAFPGTTLPCIALSNSPSATVGIGPLAAGGTGGAGAGSTTTYPGGTGSGATAVDTLGYAPNDMRGTFILAAAGTPVAGLIAQVNFTQPFARPIGGISVECVDLTASPVVPVSVAPQLTTTAPGCTTGFQITATPALTAAHNYEISYTIIP
jgi:hypothetical protein